MPPRRSFVAEEHMLRSICLCHAPVDRKLTVICQNSVDELKDTMQDVLNNPRSMAYVTKSHGVLVQSIYDTADTSKKKRKRTVLPDTTQGHPDALALKEKLDRVMLKCWPLTQHAASFIRPPKHSDHNTLTEVKTLVCLSNPPTPGEHEALVFVTVYDKLSWGHKLLSRSSQHVLLAAQTLGDLFEAIPCCSNEIPDPRTSESGHVTGYDPSNPSRGSAGCVLCINGLAHGDGQNEEDYSDKLLKHLNTLPVAKRPQLQKGPSLHEAYFTSLSFRLHEPYWLLHTGNCEHFVVIDQVRLRNFHDPPSSAFPLTSQITPPLLDMCRACNKVPAVYAIIGDVRLGETPFVICGPCWRWMGEPNGTDAESIIVVPLPKHEHGW
ncbi:hypothetical protein CERSUDRAFT_83638 [Gelatoporia subvermispora B]|uniref:snRNA-activating protein complex subunit 3 n=1 Tax=Ceriporiopsis subvermispora (strain B) TaxID=914234 RepID=M2RGG6_CERS8|nr:hypothetical protein CERSUDRAFT_83638 [Gelatoporia subvermispora B]